MPITSRISLFLASILLTALSIALLTSAAPLHAQSISAASPAPLGFGVSGDVDAFVVNGTDVFVAGSFTEVCGNATCDSGNTTVNNVAKWNGTSWETLGNGLNGAVTALAMRGTDLIAGGFFSESCGNEACDSGNTTVNYVAKWNGSTWSALGGGVSEGVYDLEIQGDNVILGGQFIETCGNTACDSGNSTVNHIAKWDGNLWSGIGNGFDDYVSAIGVKGKKIFAGGHFKQICGNGACDSGNSNAHNIARWNGSSWSALGMGVSNDPNAIAVIGTNVYIAGFFSGLCTDDACVSNLTPMRYITRWNGSSFQPVGFGLGFIVYDLYLSGGAVYAGGNFNWVCGNEECDNSNITVNRIAKWNGASWTGFDFGVNDNVTALTVSEGELHAGGSFFELCGNEACDTDNTAVNHLAGFTIPPCSAKPAKPELNAPLNNTVTTKARPTLTWSPVECADTYQAIIKDTATGAVVDKSEKDTKLKYKTDLLPDGTYKWVVKVCSSVFGCAKSNKYKFTVE
jgi:hypothetical protein